MQINILSRLKFQVFRDSEHYFEQIFILEFTCWVMDYESYICKSSWIMQVNMVSHVENFWPIFELQSYFIQSYSVYFRLIPINSDQFRSLLVQGNLNHSRIGLTRVSLRVYTSLHPSYTRDWLGKRFGSFLTGWSEHVLKTWFRTFLIDESCNVSHTWVMSMGAL